MLFLLILGVFLLWYYFFSLILFYSKRYIVFFKDVSVFFINVCFLKIVILDFRFLFILYFGFNFSMEDLLKLNIEFFLLFLLLNFGFEF